MVTVIDGHAHGHGHDDGDDDGDDYDGEHMAMAIVMVVDAVVRHDRGDCGDLRDRGRDRCVILMVIVM